MKTSKCLRPCVFYNKDLECCMFNKSNCDLCVSFYISVVIPIFNFFGWTPPCDRFAPCCDNAIFYQMYKKALQKEGVKYE